MRKKFDIIRLAIYAVAPILQAVLARLREQQKQEIITEDAEYEIIEPNGLKDKLIEYKKPD